ncbi:hypothetical protein [Arthrobacter celericrescens]|uniref:hypothetical protein n=1 Tax=Arthrobacter celericrescens TaxID=2320851 RepID=UPI0013C45F70|nr:hypothetical protein [Arthrobacter celericrescens]
MFTVLATSKVAAGLLAAGAVTVGGSGAAAFAGVLPADLQQKAHELIGAPAPAVQDLAAEAAAAKAKAAAAAADAQAKAADAADEAQAKASDAVNDAQAKIEDAVEAAKAKAAGVALPESFGLCRALLSGGLNADAKIPGYQSLVVAAGGEGNVGTHCEHLVAGVEAEFAARGAADAEANAGANAGENAALPAVPATPAVPAAPAVPATPAVPAVPGAPAELPGQVDGPVDSVRP